MSGRSALLFYVGTARKESHAYFRNPSHLINSLDARKYDRVGTKSHVLESGSTMGKKLQKSAKKGNMWGVKKGVFFPERPMPCMAMAGKKN